MGYGIFMNLIIFGPGESLLLQCGPALTQQTGLQTRLIWNLFRPPIFAIFFAIFRPTDTLFRQVRRNGDPRGVANTVDHAPG